MERVRHVVVGLIAAVQQAERVVHVHAECGSVVFVAQQRRVEPQVLAVGRVEVQQATDVGHGAVPVARCEGDARATQQLGVGVVEQAGGV